MEQYLCFILYLLYYFRLLTRLILSAVSPTTRDFPNVIRWEATQRVRKSCSNTCSEQNAVSENWNKRINNSWPPIALLMGQGHLKGQVNFLIPLKMFCSKEQSLVLKKSRQIRKTSFDQYKSSNILLINHLDWRCIPCISCLPYLYIKS